MRQCNICDTSLGDPIFISDARMSITSLCELVEGRVQIWVCKNCGHLLGNELPNIKEYYENDYRILLNSDDEDQIYEVIEDKIIYRTDHQANTLLKQLHIPPNALLLDYGCAKASTPKRLLAQKNDLKIHLFDVSGMYISYWNDFVPEDCQAIHNEPKSWQKRFDLVTSFFALEHISHPRNIVRHIASLLKDDGVFYGIVPDTFGNVADFVVMDHVNHFTKSSLQALLFDAGFNEITIDPMLHRGALVFSARMQGSKSRTLDANIEITRATSLSKYWQNASNNILEAESKIAGKEIAIYGSGFYGSYIFSVLKNPENIKYFIDRSPFQQGKILFGTPILAPENLPENITTMFIGLNPSLARETIGETYWSSNTVMNFIFLDEYTK